MLFVLSTARKHQPNACLLIAACTVWQAFESLLYGASLIIRATNKSDGPMVGRERKAPMMSGRNRRRRCLGKMGSIVQLLLIVVLGAQGQHASAQVVIPTQYISVGDYTGTANQRINAAIAAAMLTTHKTVYFPNGTYALRSGLQLNQGTNTELHLIGESKEGVFLVPDVAYLEANYNGGNGASLAHILNLSSASVFQSVDVSIQNMTLDMRSQQVLGAPVTYNVVGHGIRVGTGWQQGQFTVNHVNIRNVDTYGVGIQDRGGHPKNNVTLSNLHIERTGSDGIDTKEASGDGNRNLVIRNVSVNEIGYLDTGVANAIDVRYRNAIIENVNLVSRASRSTLPGQTSINNGINFRRFESGYDGIIEANVSGVYIRGFSDGIAVESTSETPHRNIAISDFIIHGQTGTGILVEGTNHSGHTISNGYVDPAFGSATLNTGGQAAVTNFTAGRWDPALTPPTDTSYERNVSLSGQVYSPARSGIIGTERISLNPTSPIPGPFVFNIGNSGVLEIDFDARHNMMDKLVVDGTVNLDGELRVQMINGTPMLAGKHRVVEADTITGQFDKVTLPTPGSRLLWNTDQLKTQGVLELVGSSFLLLGDVDNFGYNASVDAVPVDPVFASLSRFSGLTRANMDQTVNNAVRLFTFDLGGPLSEAVSEAWLEMRVRELNGFDNDALILENNSSRQIATLEVLLDNGADKTLLYNLTPNELSMLRDGRFSVALQDDHAIDWIGLGWTTVPEPSSLTLLSLGGLAMIKRRRRDKIQ